LLSAVLHVIFPADMLVWNNRRLRRETWANHGHQL